MTKATSSVQKDDRSYVLAIYGLLKYVFSRVNMLEPKVVNEISSCLDESNIENELLINEENYYAEKVYGGV